jgi:hypothetical protein
MLAKAATASASALPQRKGRADGRISFLVTLIFPSPGPQGPSGSAWLLDLSLQQTVVKVTAATLQGQ